jgi:phosphatidylglycerol:prolipoprotein diacylglycerol transferase
MDSHSLAYSLMTLTGMGAAFATSRFLDMPKPPAKAQLDIYVAAVAGFLVGAKLPVWASYGFHPALMVDGKSVMGAMLGAFVALNIYKYASGKRDEALGGRFAIPLAVAIGFGKIGCYIYGCCGGNFVVPVQLFESGFQFAAAGLLYLFYRRTGRVDLLFPLYLTAYISMRFFIEFVRIEPRILWGMTIYQYLALLFLPVLVSILYGRRHVRCPN